MLLQEKNGTLSVKQRKRGVAGSKEGKDAFKTLGVVPLELHNLSELHRVELTWPLSWCVEEGAELSAIVSARQLEVGGPCNVYCSA